MIKKLKDSDASKQFDDGANRSNNASRKTITHDERSTEIGYDGYGNSNTSSSESSLDSNDETYNESVSSYV